MNKIHDNLVGTRFHKLTILRRMSDVLIKNGHNVAYRNPQWECKCDCGNIKVVKQRYLINKITTSCGCYKRRDRSYFMPNTEISNYWWYRFKNQAKKRNIEFNLTPQYLWNLYLNQNKTCALSGVDLYMVKNRKEFRLNLQTASVDRINSLKAYIEGNVQWVHVNINYMKSDLDQNEFIDLCKKIVKFNTKNVK